MPATLVRREGVEILKTGTYLLSTGEHTFTEEDLKAAIAALKDPAVKLPRIKIDGLSASFDPDAHGGEPACGHIENLRLVDNDQTLVGDYVMPDWLDGIVDWAYPSRSIEGPPRGWVSATGRAHDLVITAVALLGVDMPGVQTLKDLAELLANGPGSTEAPVEVLARMTPPERKASLDQDIVRSRFVDQLDNGQITVPDGVSPWDWWPTCIRIDDNQKPYLIVKDEAEGRVYRVDFTVAGNEVTFNDPVEQIVQYVAATGGTKTHQQIAVWATRAESRPEPPSTEEESPVDPKQLRESIGLAEDASDEDVKARLAELNARPDTVKIGDETIPVAEVDEKVAEAIAAARDQEKQRIAASGGKVVDEAELAQLREDAKAGRVARDEQVKASRTGYVEDAIRAGKFPPARRDHYLALLDKDEQGTREFIDQLEANAIPVAERGVTTDPDTTPDNFDGGTGLFPQLAASKEN